MTSFFSSLSWRMILIYGLLISLMGSYAWTSTQDQKNYNALRTDSIEVLEELKSSLDRSFSQVTRELRDKNERVFMGYADLYKQARQIEISSEAYIAFLRQELNSLANTFPVDYDKPPSKHSSQNYKVPSAAILQTIQSAADSMRYWALGDSLLIHKIDSIFAVNRLQQFEKLLNHGTLLEQILVVSILQFDLQYLTQEILIKINGQVPYDDEWIQNSLFPMMSTNIKKECLQVGDPFEADFYAGSYPSQKGPWDNVQFLVNGKSIPIVDGVGRYSPVYKTAGEKTIHFEALITNPLTNRVNTYIKDFGLKICE